MSEPQLINQQFTAQSNSIASYNYTDIAEGTGVVRFYGMTTEDNTATSYELRGTVIYSNDVLTAGTGTSALSKVLDIDFDTSPFNLPKELKGTLIAQISLQVGHETITSWTTHAYAIVKVRKWDGTTETEIASNTKSDTVDTTADFQITAETVTTSVSIPTRTHFKKGEMLRITVEVWATGGDSGSKVALLHDPKDRIPQVGTDYGYNGGAEAITVKAPTSQLIFDVPFVLTEIGY